MAEIWMRRSRVENAIKKKKKKKRRRRRRRKKMGFEMGPGHACMNGIVVD
jgi:hypothetical protein